MPSPQELDAASHREAAFFAAADAEDMRALAQTLEAQSPLIADELTPLRRALGPEIWDSVVARQRAEHLAQLAHNLAGFAGELVELGTALRQRAAAREAEADFHLAQAAALLS